MTPLLVGDATFILLKMLILCPYFLGTSYVSVNDDDKIFFTFTCFCGEVAAERRL